VTVSLSLRSVARTHVGRVRRINEDRLLDRPDRGLWAVADGMGGHSAGDIAAEAVIAALQAVPADASDDIVEAALVSANKAIHDRVAGSSQVSGSTVVALHRTGEGRATILWAGDSRGYRLRDGTLVQLTRDHSVVQEMVDAGVLSPDRAETHPQAHVITRALGTSGSVAIDRVRTDVRAGDIYLLCSDGLSREIGDEALARTLALPITQAADTLLADALAAGGTDNISFVLIEA
jgi:serine/threonine protein phosphatase PrpC